MENQEFELLSLEKRHLEIIEALKLISESLSQEEDNSVLEAILAQGDKLKSLISVVSKIPAPEVTVDVDLEELKLTFETIKQEIIDSNSKVIETIENRLLPFSFDLNREANGLTTSVKVNYKPANEINNI